MGAVELCDESKRAKSLGRMLYTTRSARGDVGPPLQALLPPSSNCEQRNAAVSIFMGMDASM
jgi:hypothetical protein